MLDTLPIADILPDSIRVRTELARELRKDRVAHMVVENSLIHRITGEATAFDDKVTRNYLGNDWDRYLEMLKDEDALEKLLRVAEPAIAALSPITLSLILGDARRLPYDPTPFGRYTSNRIVDAITGRGPATIVASWPPRHGKTMLISRRSAEWILLNYSNKSVGICGYNDSFAADHGRTARNDIQDSPEIFGFGIATDSSAAAAWNTTEGGGLWTAGTHGSATGRGADFLVIDDSVKDWQDANSLAARDENWSWYTTTARTRLQQGGITALIHTRWHEDDLTGRVLASAPAGEVVEIKFPALCELEEDEIGRVKGGALWPSKYPVASLERTRREVGEESWFALYAQSPLGASSVGRAYPNFNPTVHIQEALFDPTKLTIVAFDFNVTPYLIELGQPEDLTHWRDSERRYMLRVFDELSLADMRTDRAVDVLGERLRRWARGTKLKLLVTGDATGKRRQTSQGPEGPDIPIIRNYFSRNSSLWSWTPYFPTSNTSVRESVMRLNTMLRTADGCSHLIIDSVCVELIEDLRSNRWLRDSHGRFLDTVDDRDSRRTHAADALRYMVRAMRECGPGAYGFQREALPWTY